LFDQQSFSEKLVGLILIRFWFYI